MTPEIVNSLAAVGNWTFLSEKGRPAFRIMTATARSKAPRRL